MNHVTVNSNLNSNRRRCTVVDMLGPDVRTHLIERFVALELMECRRTKYYE
jgi:hypothetical protein